MSAHTSGHGTVPAGEATQLVVGGYRLGRVLGEGATAVVYEAVDPAGRRLAVKLLHRELAASAEVEVRFFNEARAANSVRHPGLVSIFDYGRTPGGQPYLAMELVEGEPLGAWLRRAERVALGDLLPLGRQLAAALAAAHVHDVVHRDLKPGNVLLVSDPAAPGGLRTKIIDFGIAKRALHLEGAGDGDMYKTRVGMLLGTPAYMAPEQCRETAEITDRADVYALGVILYQALAGVLPFDGAPLDLMIQHVSDPPPPVMAFDPTLPEELAALLDAMLAKEPEERPAMLDVERELARIAALVAERPVASSETVGEGSVAPPAGERARPSGGRRRLGWGLVGGFAVAAAIVACVVGTRGWIRRGSERGHPAREARGDGRPAVRSPAASPAAPASRVGGSGGRSEGHDGAPRRVEQRESGGAEAGP